ncbi:MAG: DUF4388 domain-containing protein [Pseudomonadota bacterium]
MPPEEQSVGNLSDRPLPHLLLWVYQTSFSGVLVLAREDVKKSIVFEKGKIVAARSNVPTEVLSALLLEEGKLTPEQLRTSLEKIHGKETMRQGEILIQMGVIDHAGLNEVLQRQLLRRIHETFSWPEGRYGFVAKIPEDTSRISIDMRIPEICYRGLFQRYKGSKEAADLQDTVTPNFVGGQNWNITDLRLVGREMGVHRVINGLATLAQIAERSKTEIDTVRAMLLSLRDLGLVRLTSEDRMQVQSDFVRRGQPLGPAGGAAADTAAMAEVMKLLKAFEGKNHFEVLGIPRTASLPDIKAAYFTLAKKLHPDRVGVPSGTPERKMVEDLFTRITEAQSILANDVSRKEYMASLDLAASGAAGGAEAAHVLNSELAFQKGGILIKKGDFAGAIDLLKEATRLYDKEPEYFVSLGWALYRQGSKTKDPAKMKEGKAEIEKALVQNARLNQAQYYLGLIAKAEGNLEKAKKQFEKTIELNRRHTEAASELRVMNMRESKEPQSKFKGLFKKKEE